MESIAAVARPVTKFVAPFVLVAYGWQMVAVVWATALTVMAIIFWLFTDDDPEIKARRARKEKPRSLLVQLEPLRHQQVWRFALYYFFVFGGFVALALWLPHTLDLPNLRTCQGSTLFELPVTCTCSLLFLGTCEYALHVQC